MVDEGLLVKTLAFMAATVTVGWFIALIIVPAFRGPDYRPAPEITALMATIFTGLAGSFGWAYIKAKHPRDDDKDGDDDAG